MTNRAARRQAQRNQRDRSAKTRAQHRAAINAGTLIPAPPEPAWNHWWDANRQEWFSHVPEVTEFIRGLANQE